MHQPTERRFELEQRVTKIHDQSRELVERCETENRAATKDEQAILDANSTEFASLNQRISNLDRTESIAKLDRAGKPAAPMGTLPHQDPANARKHSYSMMRAISCLVRGQSPDGIEGEVSQEIQSRLQCSTRGFRMPHSLRGPLNDAERRALDTTSGAGMIPTIQGKDWIELLRNKSRVIEAGALQVPDLTGGLFQLPRQNAAATAYWVGQGNAPNTSNLTFDQVSFTPHTLGAVTDITRRFFELNLMRAGDELVMGDQSAILARGLDLAALNGSGASNQPLGILQNTAITSPNTIPNGANGAAPTWALIVKMHTLIAQGNAADLGPTAYITNGQVKGTLASTVKAGTFPIFILSDDGSVYGKPLLETQQIPSNLTKGSGTSLSAMVYGVWNQLVMAYWSGLDVLVDPYTGGNAGTIRVITLQDVDIEVRHNEAFSVMVDLVTS